MFVPREGPRYTETEAREAIAASSCWSEALRHLGVRPAGGHHKTLKKWAARWQISNDHFDPNVARAKASRAQGLPLATILVEGSTYSRGHLKERLYEEGLKQRACELCGQGESWRGQPMSLILDHVNGVGGDHRLENLRIVCPNCAATLQTHCGRHRRRPPRACLVCGEMFLPRYAGQRHCGMACWRQSDEPHRPKPEQRKVPRPPYDQLLAELEASSYVAVAREYGVSDNAVRKWVRWYQKKNHGVT